jgi:hypothetical protein
VAQPAGDRAEKDAGQYHFLQLAPQPHGRKTGSLADPLHGAADAHQAQRLQMQMQMIGLHLVAQHLGRRTPVRCQRLQPHQDRPRQALAHQQRLPVRSVADAKQREVGAVEPGLRQIVLLPVVVLNHGQTDAHRLRDIMQVHGVPTAPLSEQQCRLQNALGRIGIDGHGMSLRSRLPPRIGIHRNHPDGTPSAAK